MKISENKPLDKSTFPTSVSFASMKKTKLFFDRMFKRTKGLIKIRALPSQKRIFDRDLNKLITFIKRKWMRTDFTVAQLGTAMEVQNLIS